VRVRSNHGIGLEPTLRPDHVIDYCGETVSVEYTFREGGEGQLNGVEQEA
jgi:hypothetical protein